MPARHTPRLLLWISVTVFVFLLAEVLFAVFKQEKSRTVIVAAAAKKKKEWQAPEEKAIAATPDGQLIRYGKALIERTAFYLGPKGTVARLSNGMTCQNCHLKGGTQNFANPFSATAATYPKYRNRSGRVESIAFRINDCMKRSLNGKELDSASREMQAMIAYIKWVGKDVPKGQTPGGAGVEKLKFLNRAASPQKGRLVFLSTCKTCHGPEGQGLLLPDSTGYVYPPLWGEHSYNVSAGLYRISSLAGFVKNNMPFGASWKKPQLTTEQVWDVAAYLLSQPRPQKFFPEDWKDLAKKPIDYPFGPFADTFAAVQHKYGPFVMMKKE